MVFTGSHHINEFSVAALEFTQVKHIFSVRLLHQWIKIADNSSSSMI